MHRVWTLLVHRVVLISELWGLWWSLARAVRLSPSSRFAELVDAWLHQLGTTKPAANTVAAYRRDLEGVARRIAADAEVGVLHLELGQQPGGSGSEGRKGVSQGCDAAGAAGGRCQKRSPHRRKFLL